MYVFMGPVAAAVMGRTVGEYILPSLGLECHEYLTALIAVMLCGKFTISITSNLQFH